MPLKLPPVVTRFIDGSLLIRDDIGESPCEVYSFNRGNDRFFVKVSPAIYAPTTFSVLREARILEWLDERLNVPEVVVVAQNEDCECMITRCIPGKPLSALIDAQRSVTELFSEALRQVQTVPISKCPFDASISFRLQELEYLLVNNLTADDYDLKRWPKLILPEDVLEHLHATKPTEELVFTHGDFGDSNIFVDSHDDLYFIDFGRGGLADRWMDIAFIHRDLREEVSDTVATDFITSLKQPDNPTKREYYELLDELF
ncbi:APH(3') family aminoglycoside O-phosphotransferase [Xenorhabdus bovienii]|uniref:APH(3') family aminoglycoside O-phosphotransferase n=1 Tax=Xenorhabdus bovienii TaxID=40576 RepID=UPI00237D27E0|nr:APH(3') family aminoglycoside O-phosphotransferase [Xenorhabdus bovienii]MDE1481567.1 aminoglycoside 3'-phosphotransferase [Xenorhabdus bovienii]MDE9440884.1 aminoglycoside 3'-phosphotransferase [Xenorhabdus bovienii]